MAARRRPDPLRRVEGEEGTRTPSLATPPVKSLELTPLDVFGQEDHSPLPEFDLELDSLVHMVCAHIFHIVYI